MLSTTSIWAFLALGLIAGVFSGLLGIGGAVIMIPVIVMVFGLSQHQAQGTTLALMVPPIGLLAAWTYYKHSYVDLRMAAFICIGFFIGGLFGAKLAVFVNGALLKKIFGISLFLISMKMIFAK